MLIRNYDGKRHQIFIDNFNHFGECDHSIVRQFLTEEHERGEDNFIKFLKKECSIYMTQGQYEEIFGFAYTSSSSYALVSLDTNYHIFIDEEYRLDHLAFTEDEIIVVASDSEGHEIYMRIG